MSNNIKTLEFIEGKKVSEKCYNKNKIFSKKLNNYCTINVSTENQISDSLCNSKLEIARIKNRISFILKDLPNFRIDITLSNTVDIKQNPHELKPYKESVLTNKLITPENFTTFSNFKDTKYEIEFEYIGVNSIFNGITVNSIKNEIDSINDFIKNEADSINFIEKLLSNHFTSFANSSLNLNNSNNSNLNNSNLKSHNSNSNNSNNSNHQRNIFVIASLIMDNPSMFKYKYGFKKLTNNVKELTKNDYSNNILNNVNNFYITDKADGLRVFLIFTKNNINSKDFTIIKINGNETIPNVSIISDNIIYIFDAEEIITSNGKIIYGIFDMLYDKSYKKLSYKDFEKRYEHLITIFESINSIGVDNINKLNKLNIINNVEINNVEINNVEINNVDFYIKSMIKLTGNSKTDKNNVIEHFVNKRKYIYNTDGYIFTPSNGNYFDMVCWKWKPIEHITIDFLVIKNKFTNEYNLFSGISNYMLEELNISKINNYKELVKSLTNVEADLLDNSDSNGYTIIQFSPSDNYDAYRYAIQKSNITFGVHGANQDMHDANQDMHDANQDLHGKICEFRRVGKNNIDDNCNIIPDPKLGFERWEFVKIRTDRDTELMKGRYFGNDFRIAELTWQNYNNPLLFDDLFNYSQDNYFKVSNDKKLNDNSDLYFNLRKLNLNIKHNILDDNIPVSKDMEKTNLVIDLAGGRGQDMFYFASKNYRHGLFVDIDKNALTELIQRKFNFKQSKQSFNMMKVYTLQADLNENYLLNYCKIKLTISKLFDKYIKADLVSAQFCIHYFLESTNTFENYINLVKNIIANDGLFIFTCFDGEKIFNLLESNKKGEWVRYSIDSVKSTESTDVDSNNSTDSNNIVYHIKKMYKSKTITNAGQKISVKLPFSGNTYYDEYLCNLNYIKNALENSGFEFIKSGSFEKYQDNNIDKRINPNKNDLDFSSLYCYNVYKFNENNNNGLENKLLK